MITFDDIKSVLTLKSTPTILTMLRIFATPVISYLIVYSNEAMQANFFIAIIFGVVSATDFIDGYIARSLNAESKFGACFDHIADKIANVCILMSLAYIGKVNLFIVMLFLSRDFVVSGLREFLNQNIGQTVAVSDLGKIKTALQSVAIFIIILANNKTIVMILGQIVLLVSLCISLFTMFQYLFTAWNQIKNDADDAIQTVDKL